MNRVLIILFLLIGISGYSQVKISAMPEVAGSPNGSWIPLVLGGSNYKINAGLFYNKLDSLYKKTGTDSIFTSTNGIKKFAFIASDVNADIFVQQLTVAELRSLSPVNTIGGGVYFITDQNKQGFFRYDINVTNDINAVDDGAMVLESANGKRFKRIVQDGTINAGWFGAIGLVNGGNMHISTLGLTFEQAKKIFDREGSPLVLTEDDYNNQNIDWFSLQRAINYCISSGDGKLFIPAGNYHINKGLLVAPVTGAFVTSFEMEGAVSAYDGPRQTMITLNNKQSFGIGLHRCKGVRIRNLFVTGSNPLSSMSYYDMIENNEPSIWINDCRVNTKSPHAGIVVDPFFDLISDNDDISDTEKYPDFISLYTSLDKSGGSTDIVFDNCRLENFIVGLMFSPHFYPQNGDGMAFNNSWIKYCRSAIGIGQSQNRSILVNNLKVWGGVETVFDCARFSFLADNVEVDGLDIAGAKYLTRLAGYYNKGLIIDRMHAESLLSLGGVFGDETADLAGMLIINNSWVDFVGQGKDSSTDKLVHAANLIFQGRTLKATNSYLIRYNGDATPLTIRGNAEFENCHFDFLPVNTYRNPGYYVNYTNNKFSYTNCITQQYNFPFGNGNFIKSGNAAEISTSKFLFLNNSELHMTRYYVGNQYKRIATENGNGLFQDYIAFQQNDLITFSSLDSLNGSGSYQMTSGTEDFNRLQTGDYLYSYDVSRKNGLGSVTWFLLGKIVFKDEITGDVSLDHMAQMIHTGTEYPVRIIREKLMFPYFIVGDVTQGSNLITNVVQELNLAGYIPWGATIQSPFFPTGTYIQSISGNTITVSNNALSSFEGADVIGADWKGEDYGTAADSWPYICCYQAYKKGDIIYNSDPINYPEVERWTCVKSGITGSSKPPKFDTTFRTSRKTLTADGGINIGKERFVGNVIVNPGIGGSVNIGTTPGGNEIATAIPLTGNSDNVVTINKYFRTDKILYFTGISTSTEIIVLK